MPSWGMREWGCCLAGILAGALVVAVTEPTFWQPALAGAMGFATTFALMRVTAPGA